MTANELRIGNIISWKSTKNIDTVYDINIPVIRKRVARINHVSINDCEPVLLTKEWLIRFGLKEVYKYKEAQNNLSRWGFGEYSERPEFSANDFSFDSSDNEIVILHNLHFKIKYVHELQNLIFALTKKELIINK